MTGLTMRIISACNVIVAAGLLGWFVSDSWGMWTFMAFIPLFFLLGFAAQQPLADELIWKRNKMWWP